MSRAEVTPFRSQLPVKLAFGDGVIGDLAEILTGTRRDVRAGRRVEEPVAGIRPGSPRARRRRGRGRHARSGREGPPASRRSPLAEDGSPRVRGGGPAAVVGIGGGSALDARQGRPHGRRLGRSARDLRRRPAEPRACTALPLVLSRRPRARAARSRRGRPDRQASDRKVGLRQPADAGPARARRPAPDARPAAGADGTDRRRRARAGDRRRDRRPTATRSRWPSGSRPAATSGLARARRRATARTSTPGEG